MKSSILTNDYQQKWSDNNLYSGTVSNNIGKNVHLHSEVNNVCSSAAACLNVMGNLNNYKDDLLSFLNSFDLEIQELINFPTGLKLDNELYDDKGFVIFEWIGSSKSPINEMGGGRGLNRTSIDAFLLAKIQNKITQILIEWKFTETYSSQEQLQKFAGKRGIERLRRYSSVLKLMRKEDSFPFNMSDEGGLGLYDFGYEPFYQLMRMHLLAKTSTPLKLNNDLTIEDYRILHLTHSENQGLNLLTKKQTQLCPYLSKFIGKNIHEVWEEYILSAFESKKFKSGYWDQEIYLIKDKSLNNYLSTRYTKS